VVDLTPAVLQGWIQDCGLKPITLRSVLKNAGSVFAKTSLQAMGLSALQNPFARLVRPKIDREPFHAPPRSWIMDLMRRGIQELSSEPRIAFVLALGAGLRWGEIVSLTWDDAQKENVRVAASKAKGRRARIIPIGQMVGEVLGLERSVGAVLRTDAREVHESLCAWLRTQGVQDPKPIHYLRKCYGSLAVADHGIYVASKLLGHSSIVLTASTYAGQVDELPAVKF
jgi:integrase